MNRHVNRKLAPCTTVAAIALPLALAAAIGWDPAHAQLRNKCDVKTTLAQLKQPPVDEGLIQRLFGGLAPHSMICSSLASAVARIGKTDKSGGRGLNESRPAGDVEIDKQRKAAAADPEFTKVLQSELEGETDTQRRLLIEAAVYIEFGHHLAAGELLRRIEPPK